MNYLSISNLRKTIGDKTLFQELSFGLEEGEKLAIVGINGSGKSTLLRLILGQEEADSGIIVKNNELKIALLNQSSGYDSDDTILEHILKSKHSVFDTLRRYTAVCAQMESHSDEKLEEEYSKLISEMDRLNAWEIESRFESLLKELGIKDIQQKMGHISGGMFKKVELVKVLLEDSNLLILDEPTNHLDIDSILWLEKYLLDISKAVILITHDRYFLDRVVGKILELENTKYHLYLGNYEFYLNKKAEREAFAMKQEEKARNFLRTELEWLGRQPKARGTKQKARIDRIQEVVSRDKFELQKEIELSVLNKRQGKTILELKDISKSFEDKVLIDKFSYHFKRKERLGVVGPNGAGKTTLLNILAGKLSVESGIVNPGINTIFGYFDQTSRQLEPGLRVLEYVKKYAGEYIQTEEGKITAGQMLERFLFNGKLQSTYIEKLSGGEKRRLYLVTILMLNPNFLILDEPTNDLDIQTLSILENFLIQFSGCVVLVSHDRYFMDRVAETLLIFEGSGKIITHVGQYSDYLERKSKSPIDSKTPEPISKPNPEKKKVEKLSFKEQKELEKLEKEIDVLENEKISLTKILENEGANFEKVSLASERIKEMETEIEKKLNRWEELSSK
jgi:ABC transport system ATP-binding/permease protein